MDPVSLISIVAGLAGALSATGALASVTLKFLQSVKAERDLKSQLTQTSVASLQAEFGNLSPRADSAVSMAELHTLRNQLDDLVSRAEISKEGKEMILSGLRQPSDLGKARYARKLYMSTVGGA
jgi:hypothetical protein